MAEWYAAMLKEQAGILSKLTGVTHRTAFDLLRSLDGLKGLQDLEANESIAGWTPANRKKLELVKAVLWAHSRQLAGDPQTVQSPEDAYSFLKHTIGPLTQEEIWAIYLGGMNSVVGMEKVSQVGNRDSAAVISPQHLFRSAVRRGETAVIFAHNHPSGNGRPSQKDTDCVREMQDMGKVLGITVHDFLVITSTGWSSVLHYDGIKPI